MKPAAMRRFAERARALVEQRGDPPAGHAWAVRKPRGARRGDAYAVPVAARSKSGDLWCYRDEVHRDLVSVLETTTGLRFATVATVAHARRLMAALDGKGADLAANALAGQPSDWPERIAILVAETATP